MMSSIMYAGADYVAEPGSLPATDALLARSITIGVGVVDAGIGSAFGINVRSEASDIEQVAKRFRTAVERQVCSHAGPRLHGERVSSRRVTLVDVAQRASVSVATVSRALSGDPQISEATQVRVRQIADTLKYVPNVAARNLVLQSSATFGLMTPDVTDPIHGQVVTGFQQQAAEHDYSVILANGFRDVDTERRALREFAAHRVAGVAVMGCALPQREVKRLLSPSPVLFIGSEHVSSSGTTQDLPTGCLRPDDGDGMRQVVAHIIERGYRSVAYVSGSSGATELIRREALLAALSARRRPKPIMFRADDVDAERLGVVAAEISKSRPDVVVCYDDKTALLLMDELRSAGVRVPADVGIVGFDDIPFARISNPRLTTVSQQSDDLGRVCVDFLLATLQRAKLPKSRQMPVALIVRETTPGPRTKPIKPPKKGK